MQDTDPTNAFDPTELENFGNPHVLCKALRPSCPMCHSNSFAGKSLVPRTAIASYGARGAPNRDVPIRGTLIKTHESVALLFASADRDEEVFDDPDEFDLAFRMAPHHCAEIPLVRLELKIALDAIQARAEHIYVGGPVVMTKLPECESLQVPVIVIPA